MINGRLEHFLDTGWFSEAELFLNGYVYWCEAQRGAETGETTFVVDCWPAQLEDGKYYHSLLEPDGSLKWSRVLEIKDNDLDRIKQQFLEAPIFDGKTFWQVERKIAWVDDGGAVRNDVSAGHIEDN